MLAFDAASTNLLFEREHTRAFYIRLLNADHEELWKRNAGLTQERNLSLRAVMLGTPMSHSFGSWEWFLKAVYSNDDQQYLRVGCLREARDGGCHLGNSTFFEAFLIDNLFSEAYFRGCFEEWRRLPNF